MSATRPKVLITTTLAEAAMKIIAESCDYEVWLVRGAPPIDQMAQHLEGKDGLLEASLKVSGAVMDRAPQLRAIANFGVGYDSIDVDAASERGILVGNTPEVLSETTADLAFALLLAAGRRLGECDRFMRSHQWSPTNRGDLIAEDVHHRTLGIIGLGRIGTQVAKRAVGFDMRVIYYDIVRKPEVEQKYGAIYVDKETLLREADYVTLHTPLTPETRQLVGAAELALMKPRAVLVNASRGACVDQTALYRALSTGQIRAAGLDVFEAEPISPNDPLLSLPNCILAPHVGSATTETREKIAILSAQNLVTGLLEGDMPALVNPEARGQGRQSLR